MRLSFGQQMQMAQKQVLAPRMIQSMEILQLPILALQERIEQELEDNPLLSDVEEQQSEGLEGVAEETTPAEAPAESEQELNISEDSNNEDDFERLIEMADNMPIDFDERGSGPSAGQIEDSSERRNDMMANMVARPESLSDYLSHQLGWFDLEPEVRKMAERIIYSLDTNGYLSTPLLELIPPQPTDLNGNQAAQEEELLKTAEAALVIVQKLDPRGVGARNLQECLLLQLTSGLLFYEELLVLIQEHLSDLENNRLPLISKKTGFSIETIQEAWNDLRTLNPKPGAGFVDTSIATVTPDVFVEKNNEGNYQVRLENGQLPSLYISNQYRTMLQAAKTNEQTRDYIKRKINSAQWLIEAIEQRRNTLIRVSQAIVDHQSRFLEEGPESIEPLKMQQIADKVGVHVTTVSRAVDDKWIQSPRGIFPLKRFFVGGTTNASGEEMAWDKVRIKLQEIVDEENKEKPLSDDALVKVLAEHGITVARRTVTKYRKAMNIPSSRQRREWSDEKKK